MNYLGIAGWQYYKHVISIFKAIAKIPSFPHSQAHCNWGGFLDSYLFIVMIYDVLNQSNHLPAWEKAKAVFLFT